MELAVVIPFFQRDAGLLARAIRSVLAQHDVQPAIIVIDDGSPVPARSELTAMDGGRIHLIEQTNAGPSAARNRGLDQLPDDTRFVAFLDSDDVWDPGHLRNALAAFRQGADLYFSDWLYVGETETRFARRSVRPDGEPLPEGNCLFRYRGDLLGAILRGSPVGTSTVAYRRSSAPDLRFREDLHAGEDLLFWMGLASAARMAAYSTRCEAVYGRGVNIAAGATWRDARVLPHLAHAARMHRMVPELHPLTRTQRRYNNDRRSNVRQNYARNLLAMLWHRQDVDWRELAAFLRDEPRLLLSLARAVVWGVAGR